MGRGDGGEGRGTFPRRAPKVISTAAEAKSARRRLPTDISIFSKECPENAWWKKPPQRRYLVGGCVRRGETEHGVGWVGGMGWDGLVGWCGMVWYGVGWFVSGSGRDTTG